MNGDSRIVGLIYNVRKAKSAATTFQREREKRKVTGRREKKKLKKAAIEGVGWTE